METKQFEHKNLFKITNHGETRDDYQALKKIKGFNDIYKHYCDFANSVKIAYLEQATDYVMEKLNITTDRDNIKTACYYSSSLRRQEKENAHKEKMIKEGWLELTIDIVKQAINENKRLEVIAKMSQDWLSTSINQVYKPFIDNNGDAFLMKPRARSRGYMLHRFENAFCKLV